MNTAIYASGMVVALARRIDPAISIYSYNVNPLLSEDDLAIQVSMSGSVYLLNGAEKRSIFTPKQEGKEGLKELYKALDCPYEFSKLILKQCY